MGLTGHCDRKKSRRNRTPAGIRSRRLTLQRAYQHSRSALHSVIQRPYKLIPSKCPPQPKLMCLDALGQISFPFFPGQRQHQFGDLRSRTLAFVDQAFTLQLAIGLIRRASPKMPHVKMWSSSPHHPACGSAPDSSLKRSEVTPEFFGRKKFQLLQPLVGHRVVHGGIRGKRH